MSKASKKKTVKAKKEEIQEITLRYDLLQLPSSQHKAGLAGLYLMIQWLKEQGINETLSARTEVSERHLQVTLNKQDVKDLFSEVYKPIPMRVESEKIRTKGKKGVKKEIKPLKTINKPVKTEMYVYASKATSKFDPTKTLLEEVKVVNPKNQKVNKKYIYEEEARKSKKKDKNKNEIEPLRIESFTEQKQFYVYEDVRPYAPLLCSYEAGENHADLLWAKLWRDMMWNILKGVPATRNPYEDRLQGKATKDVDTSWNSLTNPKNHITKLPSSFYLGAQEKNAENVSFQDASKHLFLLHFSPLVWQVYVPQTMKYDTNRKDYKLVDAGFAICIPDISHLQSFCDLFPEYMQARSPQKYGYKPMASVVYINEVAGYDSSFRLHQALKAKLGESFFELIHAQDILHCEKDGNNIRIRSTLRIRPNFDEEEEILKLNQTYANYLFKKQIIHNHLHSKDDLHEFFQLCSTFPHKYFFKYGQGNFKNDTITFFAIKKQEGEMMPESKSLEVLVYQVIKSYLYGRLEAKFQLKWDNSIKGTEKEKDYNDKKEKVAKEAFLAIRGRKDKQDFINYFTASICAFSQRLGEDGYLTLVNSLYDDSSKAEPGWEKVRALCMLALSANS
ncbi:MAG: type I-MYXAN CRISPR-associated protein Cmx8 [Spirochaetota bacterium]